MTKKTKIMIPPEREMSNMDFFPHQLWMQPWFETREQEVDTAVDLPVWMNDQAREEILAQLPLDHNKGAFWWANMWANVPQDQARTPEFLMLATAMAATMGWPKVVENLLEHGAPTTRVIRPASGWSLLDYARCVMKTSSACSVLDACLWGMKGFTTVAPLHPGRAQALEVLFRHGAKPQDIAWKTAKELLSHGALASRFIDEGLQASKSSTASDREGEGEILMDILFSSRIDLAAAARGRVLDAFIRNGMPVHVAPGKPSLIQYMASSVAGLSQMPVALRHPDKEALGKDLLANRALLEKRAERMNEETRKKFLSQVLLGAVLDAAIPPTSRPAVRPRF